MIAEGFDPTTQQLLLLAAVVIAGFVVMRMVRRARPLVSNDPAFDPGAATGADRAMRMAGMSRRGDDPTVQQYEATRRDVEKLLVELDELARDISGQVDTRAVKLQQLVADADRRIGALRILLDAARAAGVSLKELTGHEDPSETAADVGRAAAANAGASQAPAVPSPADSSSTEAPIETRSRRIYELSDGGMPPHQIARRLGEPLGEVELILNLREATGGEGWPGGSSGAAK